jgi:hypothetical protein
MSLVGQGKWGCGNGLACPEWAGLRTFFATSSVGAGLDWASAATVWSWMDCNWLGVTGLDLANWTGDNMEGQKVSSTTLTDLNIPIDLTDHPPDQC